MSLAVVLESAKLELLSNFLRYFLTAGSFFLVFWVWKAQAWRHRRIQDRVLSSSQAWFEIKNSLQTVVVFSMVGLVTLMAVRAGKTRVYAAVSERGWDYLALSLALMAVLHDAYFYWTHRLLHLEGLYPRVHKVHHGSASPTPWAAYSFHPLEALVQAGIYPLIVSLIPAHPIALGLFLLYMIVRNVVGHLGFEIFPRGFARRPLTSWHTTTTHHDMHHRYFTGNYGLYFTWWDRLMGTTHADYPKLFDEITSRRLAGVSHGPGQEPQDAVA